MQEQLLINNQHPVLKHHKAYGKELLPGLAYIDLIYQTFRENGFFHAGLELRHLSIFHPLAPEQGESILLSVDCTENGEGQWKVEVKGQKQGDEAAETKVYAAAQMHSVKPAGFQESVRMNAVKQTAAEIPLEDIYAECRDQELVHSGMMKGCGSVYQTEKEIYIDLSVQKDQLEHAEETMFHPALIDASSIGSNVYLAPLTREEGQLFLPLFYESFYCAELLQTTCITKIKKESVTRKKDLVYVTMEFFNEEGRKVGELKNFANKLVRDPELINQKRQKKEPDGRNAVPAPQAEPAPSEPRRAEASAGLTEQCILYLKELLAARLNKPVQEIDPDIGYYEMGLDSPGLLDMVKEIEQKIGTQLLPTLLFEYTTIAELAGYLCEHYGAGFGHAQSGHSSAEPLHREKKRTTQNRVKKSASAGTQNGDIAIVGMAGRYPGAKNLREFWTNLKNGENSVTEVPRSRWDTRKYEHLRSPSGKPISKWGGFIDDPDCFDAKFFRISPREAEAKDPQERLFLETCWETIEDAGYTPETIVQPKGPNKRMNVGVFAGVMHMDYSLAGAEAAAKGLVFPYPLNYAPIANRVSYFCNFHGPSMAVDTVCSSSLTAVHMAAESLRRGECEAALAGGVNLSLHPTKYITYGLMDMHSSDGLCRTFGEGGTGYVSADGIGAVLLKPLHKAEEDKDHIYAVIKGSAVNHVGTVSGITVPSPVAQGDMIAECLEKTEIDPRTISYVEAHGTGTSLGDPIEIQGLVKAYRTFTEDRQFCAIGSVKSNIGHAESAAGISGLHKTVLQLFHKTLVPSLHSETINPYLRLEDSPFYVQQKTESWKKPAYTENGREHACPRRAGISSFGATGSNVHLILEEYRPKNPGITENQERPYIVPLSAKNPERLKEYAARLLMFLKDEAPEGSGSLHDKRDTMQNQLENALRSVLADVLHVEAGSVDDEQDWKEFGLDVMQLTQFSELMTDQYGLAIDMTDLIQHTSVRTLAECLTNDEKHKDILSGLFGQSGLDKQPDESFSLRSLAYTLQTGRLAMEERLVFLVNDQADLIRKLTEFTEQKRQIDGCFQGRSDSGTEIRGFLNDDQDTEELIRKWMDSGTYKKLAELWSKGFEIDWTRLYQEEKPRRMSLPTYPFAKERYWIPEPDHPVTSVNTESRLHPLLHRNTSDLLEQKFSTILNGDEFFLADHIVRNKRVLPGAAYLEMARAAAELAAAPLAAGYTAKTGISLRYISWIRQAVHKKEPLRMTTGLSLEDNGNVSFQVYSNENDSDIYCEGSAVIEPLSEAPVLHIEQLKARCRKKVLSKEDCYAAFAKAEIVYGPSHQGIDHIYCGEKEALAKLVLPASVSDEAEQFVLHPSLIDSAFQAAIGVMNEDKAGYPEQPLMPFELHELTVFHPCSPNMWAAVFVTYETPAVRRMDIDICDERGNVCVRIKGFSARMAESAPAVTDNKQYDLPGNLTGAVKLMQVWDAEPIDNQNGFPISEAKAVIMGGTDGQADAVLRLFPKAVRFDSSQSASVEVISDRLRRLGKIQHMIWFAPQPADSDSHDQKSGVLQIFRAAKALIGLGYGKEQLGMTVITHQAQPITQYDEVRPAHSGVHGFVGSLAKEHPSWHIRLADLEDGGDFPAEDIFSLPRDRTGKAWVRRHQEWYRPQLLPVQSGPSESVPYRYGGVYVIIGGAGGIGEVWTDYMVTTYKARVVWIGRRPLDSRIRQKIDRYRSSGPAPEYIAADASDLPSLQRAYEQIKNTYGTISGVVHSAMVFANESVKDMEESQFHAGLAAKVDISVNIAEVFAKESLDFILFFSSVISYIKNPNQSHYAAGCAFKDAFAHELSGRLSCRVKVMNWGYWERADNHISEEFDRLSAIGLGLISRAEGMQALETLLTQPISRMGLMKLTKPIPIEGMNPHEFVTI
ncbi:SDR family NAD(P)-dependent oxidoreductase [Bacillus velezensis]